MREVCRARVTMLDQPDRIPYGEHMLDLYLVGIGAGNPEHLTLEAVRVLQGLDLILIPNKRDETDDLAALRREICNAVLPREGGPRIEEFSLPGRDDSITDYKERVRLWHDNIARVWADAFETYLEGGAGKVGFLVWGDPSLYDSTIRIAERLAATHKVKTQVIPGITSIQALTAGHAIPINEIGAPFTVTTGRRLREKGWPPGCRTIVVMLDGDCAFQALDPDGVHIWWSAYGGMAQEIRLSGRLDEAGPVILETRAKARARHGWIMDTYVLRRTD